MAQLTITFNGIIMIYKLSYRNDFIPFQTVKGHHCEQHQIGMLTDSAVAKNFSPKSQRISVAPVYVGHKMGSSKYLGLGHLDFLS